MNSKVYVGNLPNNCQPDSLRDLFSGYGIIKDLDVIKNFAFVRFESESDAQQAVKDLDNTKLLGQVITVQISKQKDKKDKDRNRRDDRRSNAKRGPMLKTAKSQPPPLAGIGALGGILGAGPNAPLGGLNLIANLAAAEQLQRTEVELRMERERERDAREPNPDVRVRREVVPTRDVPNASRLGISGGYVIYERYYVDPSHPLLKGLPIPELPRMTDSYVSRESYRPVEPQSRRDDYEEFRDRSPLMPTERNYNGDRLTDLRDVDYGRQDYFNRR